VRRYHFSLESARRARRAQEDLARQRLADTNHRLAQARSAESAALAAYRSEGTAQGPLDLASFLAARAREVRLAEALERARRVTREIEVEAAVCYAAWVEVGKSVASLDRLDERRRSDWEAEVRREEAAAVDDVVASRWSLATPQGTGL
jgi:hypothetical protein